MQEPAPTGNIQPVDQRDAGVRQKIEDNLRQLGHNTVTQPPSIQPIGLTDDLRQAGVDAAHIIGSTYTDIVEGKGGANRDRVATSRNPIKLALERAKRKLAQKKAA